MDTIINIEEVQTELDRAARDAQAGPADVRAGRFIHDETVKPAPSRDKAAADARTRKQNRGPF